MQEFYDLQNEIGDETPPRCGNCCYFMDGTCLSSGVGTTKNSLPCINYLWIENYGVLSVDTMEDPDDICNTNYWFEDHYEI